MTDKNLTVTLSGKQYKVDEAFPEELLKKNYSGNSYIPIDVIRDIMRQIGGFSSPLFSDLEIMGKSVYKDNDVISYKQKVTLMYGEKVLHGEGYHPVTAGKLFSDASTGVFSTLRSKCLRDALKYEFKIFEYPDGEDEDVLGTKDNTEAKKVKETTKPNTTKQEAVDKTKTEKSERLKKIEDYNSTIGDTIASLEKEPELKEDAKTMFSGLKEELGAMKLTPDEKKILLANRNKLESLLK